VTLAIAGNRRAAGVAVAEINLKLIWDVFLAIRIGATGHAFILDGLRRLIAHPDISRVLRGADGDTLAATRRLHEVITTIGGPAVTENLDGDLAVIAVAPIPSAGWEVFAEQPVAEAFAPIRFALWRTGLLVLGGTGLAGLLALFLARWISGPIRILEEGVERIGAGDFRHRLAIPSGDEFGRLAARFNRMAEELAVSQERSERIGRLKRFLAPQVAEIVERAGDDSLLVSRRVEVVVVFCDLRDFTAFSARAGPDEIMRVLGEYYETLGSVITRYEATLTSFSGDGLMVLLNAPVPCHDPAGRAIAMSGDMQRAVQDIVARWRVLGHKIGFGVGAAMGPATVGRIGTESRLEYTAIGSVVNLASRLCAMAADGQILVDPSLAQAVHDRVQLISLGPRAIKGLDGMVPIHAVAGRSEAAASGS
jgi:class 3 adenylate cyclase